MIDVIDLFIRLDTNNSRLWHTDGRTKSP